MPDAKVRELKELYEEADRFAREVGEFQYEVPIPAHNELRYAGHHLLPACGKSRDSGIDTTCPMYYTRTYGDGYDP